MTCRGWELAFWRNRIDAMHFARISCVTSGGGVMSGAEWIAAYEKLDAAVTELHRLLELRDPEPPSVLTDYVLVLGAMYLDAAGRRGGFTTVLPRGGSQPSYITKGLMREGLDLLARGARPTDL